MAEIIRAVFDGEVFRPTEPILLEANIFVEITIEMLPPEAQEPVSFLKTARLLNLEGPSDWSTNLDHYLYGPRPQHES